MSGMPKAGHCNLHSFLNIERELHLGISKIDVKGLKPVFSGN